MSREEIESSRHQYRDVGMKQPSRRRSHCLAPNGARDKIRDGIVPKDTGAPKGREEEWRALLHAMSQRAFMMDTQGTIIVASEALAQSLGKSLSEVIGSSLSDLFPPEVVERLRRRVDKSIRTGKPVRFKGMCRGRYCAYSVQPVFGAEEKVARVAISVTDITERKRAEEALKENEGRYRLLAEASSDIIYTTDTNGRFTYVSPSITGLLGYTVEEMLPLAKEEYLTSASLDVALKAIREDQALESLGSENRPRTRRFEMELRRKDGSTVWTDTNLTYLRDRHGKLIGHLGAIRDITERKQVEEALQKAKEFTDSLIASMQDGLSILDSNGVHTEVNPALCDMTGFSREELIGTGPPHPYWPPESLEEMETAFQKVLKGEFGDLEMTFMRKDGERFPVIVTPSWVKDKRGNAISYFATVKDITQRKQTEEALRQREEEYRLLIENANEAISVACDGILCFVNSKATEMTGYSKEELTSAPFVNFIHPDDREMVAERHVRRLRGEQFPGVYPFRIVDKAGNTKWLEISAVLISWKGKPATLNFLIDITGRKQALDELRNSYEQLRSLYRRLQSVREEERISIAREVHDELGQALIGLKMDISWLEARLHPTDVTLLDKARAMSEAIDNTIKAVKRISTTLRPPLLDDLGLVAAVQWQAEEFQKRTKIKCQLHLDGCEELPEDAELDTGIFRILQEALSNVNRHARATRVKVSLLQRDGELLLKVSDNGRGIEKDQISSPESLGLVGIRERAALLEGASQIVGRRGRGTVLTVAIPMVRGMKSDDKNTGS
ncbi:MAG: PAS domain S-box protein [Chloroflexi bacterium]|nr:PAS domain S-box protein [Chloroflexota bacterium]